MKLSEPGSFDGRIVTGADKRDDAFFSGVGVYDQALEARRDDFIFFREQKNRWRVNGFGVRDAVQIGRKFLCERSGSNLSSTSRTGAE